MRSTAVDDDTASILRLVSNWNLYF